ncbi:MAG: 30S ribosomal protein S17 [Aridibacter sp.]
MPKKTEEVEETKDETVQEETTEIEAVEAETDAPKAKKKMAKAKKSDDETASDDEAAPEETENSSIIEVIASTVSTVVETVAETVSDAATSVVNTVADVVGLNGDEPKKSDRGNRSERIGVVASDKMQKTVSVRVDRLVKHPMYRKYVRKKKKFLAHDEMGAAIGDKVRIVETRPLSARKRWRVVEIIQKAER